MGQALNSETCAILPVSYSDDGDKENAKEILSTT